MTLPETGISLWRGTSGEIGFPPLAGGAEAEVCIIGGGIVGLTCARLLKRAGRRVVVIEADRIAGRSSGGTTAKLTLLHRLIYADLIGRFGEATARLYAEANQAGLDHILATIREEGIACDLERLPAYTYSEHTARLGSIRQEVEAAQRLALPASFEEATPLPFPVAGAIRLPDQAQFHPRKYLLALARALPGEGCELFEQTRALRIEGGRSQRVVTDRGTVRARDVIIATHLPFPKAGLHFAKAFPFRHPMMAARIDPEAVPWGMFITAEEQPSLSIRFHREEERAWLIAVGGSFRPGGADMGEQLRQLEGQVRGRFDVGETEYRWGNQDYYSQDRLPFVGRLTCDSERLYMATGFNAWGLTNGSAAALLLCDRVLERPNPWARLYDSTRFDLRVAGRGLLKENLQVAKGWLIDHLAPSQRADSCEVAPGEGAICRDQGRTLAIYRDPQGVVHRLSPHCTHMGCLVSWNSAEKSWECPCHGSRFSPEGRLLEGPAVSDLEGV